MSNTTPAITLNVIVSGVSVSGDIDTTEVPIKIQLGNSDKIGYVSFLLQNQFSTYSNLTVSGNATVQVDANYPTSGVLTLFRGTVEVIEPEISVRRGSIVMVHCYDYGQELLGAISPDARIPYLLTTSGTFNILSGDGGMGTMNGMDLPAFISGVNLLSGATIAQLLSQFYGTITDPSGTGSGQMFSLKPYISGASTTSPWRTFYYPDASGGVATNDNNKNYFVPIGSLQVKREYAWDILRKLTRQKAPIDSAGTQAPFEVYIGVSGDIHFFTSGSYEFLLSGINGQLALQYYATGKSGAGLNNIIEAKLPFDTTAAKNYVLTWIPPWVHYPIDGDALTDVMAYSGGYWSGNAVSGNFISVTLSGNSPATNRGFISIMATAASGNTVLTNSRVELNLQISGGTQSLTSGRGPVDVAKWNVSGGGVGVSLTYLIRTNSSGGALGILYHDIGIYDYSGNFIMKSGGGGTTNSNTFSPNARASDTGDTYQVANHVIYTTSGTFLSGTGQDGGWKESTAGIVFSGLLSRVAKILIGISEVSTGGGVAQHRALYIDNLAFAFNYPFSPITAQNSGSQAMLGRRYAVVEYPFEVTDAMASGIANYELNSRMGEKGVGAVKIKDNLIGQQIQLNVKPGQVLVIDAPSLNTGSGQTFYYWKAIDVTHEWSAKQGLVTTLRVVPWFSGTVTSPYSNVTDYEAPLRYTPIPPRTRTFLMPITTPWPTARQG